MNIYHVITILLFAALLCILFGLRKISAISNILNITMSFMILITFMSTGALAQLEDDDVVVSTDDKPIILPELARTATYLEAWLEEFMWQNSTAYFLSDNYTPGYILHLNGTEVKA